MPLQTRFPRGSQWRQWDLHVHTPASFQWTGGKFDFAQGSTHDAQLIDDMIAAFNNSEPAVFGIMDYWTFDGWIALQKRLGEPAAPALRKTVFPGMELRLAAPTTCRLNAHVLFSDTTSLQQLHDFKSKLELSLIARPLSNDALISYARAVGADKLRNHGFVKAEIDSDDAKALFAGSSIAEITPESYKAAIDAVPADLVLGFLPFDTHDGLHQISWRDHYAYVLTLFKSSPVFETRDFDRWGAFVGIETAGNSGWIDNFQSALGNVPRLAVSGSDAHRFVGTKGDNNNRGYGDYPSGKITWIKADTTFRGLLQAVKEPAKRSFVGDRPPKLRFIEANKTYFVDSVSVARNEDSTLTDTWLDGCDIPLNPDLVAIIGNKGSGKSALADIVALLGNSQQHKNFSFLKRNRFLGKNGEPASHFTGRLKWLHSDEIVERRLSEPPSSEVELIRYITQGHFEELCNEHVAGTSTAFEDELRKVIFSHAGEDMRLGAFDFDELIEQRERGHRDRLNEHRKDLNKLNQEIVAIEEKVKPEVTQSLRDLLTLKKNQIEEHQRVKPELVAKPDEDLTGEQIALANQLAETTQDLQVASEWLQSAGSLLTQVAGKSAAVKELNDRVGILEKQIKQFVNDTEASRKLLGLPLEDVITFKVEKTRIEAIATRLASEKEACELGQASLLELQTTLAVRQSEFEKSLNAPQLKFQQSLQSLEAWEKKLTSLVGSEDEPDSQKGIESRLEQLKALPASLAQKRHDRSELTSEIYDTLDSQRKAREELFAPVQELIASNKLIRDAYKLQFITTFGASADALSDTLFSIIKQNTGDFRGDDRSRVTIQKAFDEVDFDNKQEVVKLCGTIHDKLIAASSGGGQTATGIAPLLRRDRSATEVYDLIFGLAFLNPRYSLRFQDTPIEQLSPGQRGALLLIFYLLVDKGQHPIILDQPEENLDNQTVVSLLVPVVEQAKARRQILMVTHNPNLAVVCDAEQIIYSSFDRKGGCLISYVAGAIEEPILNRHVVNVLEGTMPAFTNRQMKYHDDEN